MKAKVCTLLSGSAAVLLTTSLSWAQDEGGTGTYAYGPHMMWGGGWYGMILGPLFFILVLLALIVGIALVVRWIGVPGHGQHADHHAPPRRAPLDILKERYARGEIDKEEFEERRRVLEE